MTARYVFRDPSGDYLFATPSPDGDGVEVTITDAETRARAMVKVPARRLSELVTGLYQQAGRPVPVLINPDQVADDWVKLDRTGGAS